MVVSCCIHTSFSEKLGAIHAMGIPLKLTRFLNNLMFTVLHGARSYELSCLTAYRFEKGLILFWMGLVGLKGLKGPFWQQESIP